MQPPSRPDVRSNRMSSEIETDGAVTRERLTRTVPLPMSSVEDVGAPASAEPPPPPTGLRARPQRRHDRRWRRQERRQRRRDRRLLQRRHQQRRRDRRGRAALDDCYQSICQLTSLLLLPLILVLALIGIILFAVFFCMPLLFFLLGLLLMYYCCTEEPIPPRALWRALVMEHNHPAPPPAPATPPGLRPEQIQDLLVKRRCLSVGVTVPVVGVVNVLDEPLADATVYWPRALDEEEVTYYTFSTPLTTEEIKEHSAGTEATKSGNDDGPLAGSDAEPRPGDAGNPGTLAAHEESKEEMRDEASTDNRVALHVENESAHSSFREWWLHQLHVTDAGGHGDDEWECPACTLINLPSSRSCAACYAPRPRKQKPQRSLPSALGPSASTDVEESDRMTRSLNRNTSKDDDDHLQQLEVDGESAHNNETNDVSSTAHEAVCEICLGEYEVGDIVTWSKNPKCKHVYHVECITDWLLRRPTCPSCRQDYIEIPETMKHAAMEGLLQRHRHQGTEVGRIVDATAIIDASLMAARQVPYGYSSSSSSSSFFGDDNSVPDSVNRIMLDDDSDPASSVDLGSDNNV